MTVDPGASVQYRTRQLARRFLLLKSLRWMPTGLVIPILVLLFTSRGWTLTEIGLLTTIMTMTTVVLELPTGGLADTIGRRKVLLTSAGFHLAANVGFAALAWTTARPSWIVAAMVGVATGVFRALDSGPLDAWFVDTVHDIDPDADLETHLGHSGSVVSFTLGGGSLLAGGLLAWDPVDAVEPMALVMLVSIALVLVDILAMFVLLDDSATHPPTAPAPASPAGDSASPATTSAANDSTSTAAPAPPTPVGIAGTMRELGTTVADTLRVARDNRVVALLLAAEVGIAVGMVSFENLFPVGLSQAAGSADTAAALMGPVSAGAWAAAGVAAAVIGRMAKRLGTTRTAIAVRLVQGATIIAMGLAGGVGLVIAAFLATYMLHGATNPLQYSMLHREVGAGNRSTALSVMSMVGFGAFSLGSIGAGALADNVSLAVAIGACAVVTAAAAIPYGLIGRRAPDDDPADDLERDVPVAEPA